MSILYYWAKVLKKLQGSAIRNSHFEKPSKANAGSVILNSSFGKYSYCGYNCKILNCDIGRFTSIADRVVIGNYHHPMEWVSTSPAFYKGRDSIPKNLAALTYNPTSSRTIIGNDVWIGEGVFIKDGITIGDGAVIGMGSVVTKDVPSYAEIAGNPARMIKMRFDEEIVQMLKEIRWWDFEDEELKGLACYFNSPDKVYMAVKVESSETEKYGTIYDLKQCREADHGDI